jgi:hypothetical protein
MLGSARLPSHHFLVKKTQADKLFDRMPGKLKKLHEQSKTEKREAQRKLWWKQNQGGIQQ